MDILTKKIYAELSARRSVFLVGHADTGKTWYLTHKLIPFLKSKKLETLYFSDCNKPFNLPNNIDAVIIDEVETLLDKAFLEYQNVNKRYYSSEYLKRVRGWHKNLRKLFVPGLFVITRNKVKEIDNLINTVSKTEWGVSAKFFRFEKNTKNLKRGANLPEKNIGANKTF